MPERSFHPERLRLARQLSGLSLEAVGDGVGISRQYLHQLETGARDPSPDLKSALAAMLDVAVSFFESPLINQVQVDHCHFRKLRTVPQSLMSQASARASAISIILERLEKVVGLPPVDFPDLPQATQGIAHIEAAADNARLFWGLGLDAPIDNMVRVLENAGAVVVRFDDLTSRIDALSVTRRRPIVVRSTAKGEGPRPRFDLAHELGHLIMHEGVVTGDAETEGQAHRFASAFLVPARAFLREFPRLSGRRIDWVGLHQMKLRWGISMRALARRAYDLGIFDAAQYRTANIHLSKSGQTKHEQGDELVPAEHPELLNAALQYAEQSDASALPRLIRSLGMTNRLFKRLTEFEIQELPENVAVI
jgi:Zn-dependent peptidase ImmA (M78 family)/DNA-binding XRE family transcriptional regulator